MSTKLSIDEQWAQMLRGQLEGLDRIKAFFRRIPTAPRCKLLGQADGQLDFTGVGDVVNIAARLGSVAAAGELLVSDARAERANLSTDGMEHRRLRLKGREEPVSVVILMAAAAR